MLNKNVSNLRLCTLELHKNIPAGNIVLCLCACKVDSTSLVVSREDSMELATSNGAMFVETSAKDNGNVVAVFERVAERVLQFQKAERETGLGNIPVTPGAAIDSDGNIVKPQPVFKPNTNSTADLKRYGIALEERQAYIENGITKRQDRLGEEKKESWNENSDFSSRQSSAAPEVENHEQRAYKEDDKEVPSDPGMCGALQTSSNTNCAIL